MRVFSSLKNSVFIYKFFFFSTAYLIVKLGPVVNNRYEYCVATVPNKMAVWIWSRDITTFRRKYEQEALTFALKNGFNTKINTPLKVTPAHDSKKCVDSATL